MPRYRVLQDGWTDSSGTHALGDFVTLTRDSPAEEVQVDRLIEYKIIEEAPITTEEIEDEQESAPTRRRPTKK